jgi:uncharacterized protein YqhQ
MLKICLEFVYFYYYFYEDVVSSFLHIIIVKWFNSTVRGVWRFFQQIMYSLLRLFLLLLYGYIVSFNGSDSKSTAIYRIS